MMFVAVDMYTRYSQLCSIGVIQCNNSPLVLTIFGCTTSITNSLYQHENLRRFTSLSYIPSKSDVANIPCNCADLCLHTEPLFFPDEDPNNITSSNNDNSDIK